MKQEIADRIRENAVHIASLLVPPVTERPFRCVMVVVSCRDHGEFRGALEPNGARANCPRCGGGLVNIVGIAQAIQPLTAVVVSAASGIVTDGRKKGWAALNQGPKQSPTFPAGARHECGCCHKVKPAKEFISRYGRPAKGCEACRASFRALAAKKAKAAR